MKKEKNSVVDQERRKEGDGVGKGEYRRPELLELGELSQLIRGRTGSFNDGNSPNPRLNPN